VNDPRPFRIGALEVVPIADGCTAIPEPEAISGKSDRELAAHRRYIPGDGRYLTDFGAFVVRAGDQTVLLDAGLGPPPGPSGVWDPVQAPPEAVAAVGDLFRRFGRSEEYVRQRLTRLGESKVAYGDLERNLHAAGVSPESVTDVVLTHLHCDHVGWVARHGVPFFPAARIWCHEADAEYFLGTDAPDERHFLAMYGVESTKTRMAPVHQQLELWRTDRVVAPGVSLWHLPGHTPGSSAVMVESGAQRGIMVGDVVHCPLELTDLRFSIAADFDADLARQSKHKLAALAAQPGTSVFSTHFPELAPGRLVSHEADGRPEWKWN
jgi:glyoxylase-like metal-dependent hydrolase (beta-lactamase superfamily II)